MNVRQQKRILHFEERLRSDESKESAVFINQQNIIIEIFVRTREHSAQDIADRRSKLDSRFLFAKMLANRLSRPQRETIPSPEQHRIFLSRTHPQQTLTLEHRYEICGSILKNLRDAFH